jgi:bifunctional DNA-binding transcriptional regulator/antitoxin component of YhaV-PrlF toxin-antitoxin module
MGYQFKVGKNNEVPLPDDICDDLDIKIGDILICEVAANSSSISMKKHCDQTLSDDDITSAGNLTRVIPYFAEHSAAAD